MGLFTFNIYTDNNEVLKDLKIIIKKLNAMPTKLEFQTALDEVTASLDNIATDIETLTGQLENGGLSEADEAEVFTKLRAVADRARSIAEATPDNPVEPTP